MFTFAIPTILGDKTPIGWTITFAYFVVAGLAYVTYRRERGDANLRTLSVGARFWLGVTTLVLCLGINKQLDLQRAVTRFGRQLAIQLHFYGQRRPLQVVFIGCIAFLGLIAMLYVTFKLKGLRRRHYSALLGMGFLAVFVVARAASFHHADVVLGMKFHNVYVNTFLELGGIVWVGCTAVFGLATGAKR